jgi:CheY-like chemotaxis protein
MPNEPIIVIDDDTDDHFIFTEVCRALRFQNEVKFFLNATSALNYLRSTEDEPFIIFSDINMPQLNGIELRKMIEKDEALRKKSIPLIFFTTSASYMQVMEIYDLTVQGLFIKEASYKDTEHALKLIFEYWQKCKHPKSYK